MLIQSHSLLAKLLGNILCQKTLSAWVPLPPLPCGLREGEGETTWRWAPEPTCQPLLSEERASGVEAIPMLFLRIRSALYSLMDEGETDEGTGFPAHQLDGNLGNLESTGGVLFLQRYKQLESFLKGT